MAKQFKNTHVNHLLSKSNSTTTACGLKVTAVTDIVNKEGLKVPATKHAYQFEPYLSSGDVCKKCQAA